MQEFLTSEVTSVQRQIDIALGGINIIVETIGPWKKIGGSTTLPPGTLNLRMGGTDGACRATQSRRVTTAGEPFFNVFVGSRERDAIPWASHDAVGHLKPAAVELEWSRENDITGPNDRSTIP